MPHNSARGYRVERKIRIMFQGAGWKVVRSGASLGESDLICVRGGKCVMVQIKSTKKKKFYYYEYMQPQLEGFPFYLVVDFGYGKIRVLEPQKIVAPTDGELLKDFLERV
ncbi:MAG: hypothetical protein NT016_02170 [Candidatus Aenigmarchaeota archaeon]|nr:hypothetical protein [Candidatus Aenigmarchaeota archaeon]